MLRKLFNKRETQKAVSNQPLADGITADCPVKPQHEPCTNSTEKASAKVVWDRKKFNSQYYYFFLGLFLDPGIMGRIIPVHYFRIHRFNAQKGKQKTV